MRIRASWLWELVAAGLLVGCGAGGADPGAGAVGSQRSDMTFTTQGPGGRWLYTVAGWQGDAALALATDSTGATIALLADSSYATPPSLPNIVLRKLNADGYLVWERAFQGSISPLPRGNGLGTDASGNIYLLWAGFCWDYGCSHDGTIDFGGGPISLGTLVKLSSTGDFIWQLPAPLGGAQELAVNANGESVFVTFNGYGTTVVKTRADGTIAWSKRRGTPSPELAVTIDLSGNVLVGGSAGGPEPFFGATFPTWGRVVVKLAASDGALVWAEQLAPSSGATVAGLTSIGTSALGTVVVAAYVAGAFSFGGQYFDTMGDNEAAFLFVLESNGKQRFARRLPDADWPGVRIAVDPAGKVSLVRNWGESSQSPRFTVTWYNLAGDYIGQLEFPVSFASGSLWGDAIAIASDHSTVVGGRYSGVTSGSAFGTLGPVATGSAGQHAFIVSGLFRVDSPSFVDEFNRISLGPDWKVTHGTFIVGGSAARGTSFASYAFWTGVPGPDDTAEVTVSAPRNLGAIVRADAASPDRNHYVGYVDMGGNIRIARRLDWVYSYLAIGPRFPSGSHRLSITATGSAPVRLTVQLDDVTVLTYDDGSPAALTRGGRDGMFDYNGLSQPIDTFRVIRR